MTYAGWVNRSAIDHGFQVAVPGVTLIEVDRAVETFIRNHGCRPAFKGYMGSGPYPFPSTCCISPNEVVVHGIPNNYTLKKGDLLTIDVGSEYNGWFVDAASTEWIELHGVFAPITLASSIVAATKEILSSQLATIKDGANLFDGVLAAEQAAKMYGCIILPQFGGHFIGASIHEEPFVPSTIDRTESKLKQFLWEKRYSRTILKEGDTLCIEPVVSFGSYEVFTGQDGWTIYKQDKCLVSHEEKCILVTKNGYQILS